MLHDELVHKLEQQDCKLKQCLYEALCMKETAKDTEG